MELINTVFHSSHWTFSVCLCLPACPSSPHGHQPLLLCCVTLWVITQSSTCTLCLFSISFCFFHCISPPPAASLSASHTCATCSQSCSSPYLLTPTLLPRCIPSALASPHFPPLTFFPPSLVPIWCNRAERHSLPNLLCSGEPVEVWLLPTVRHGKEKPLWHQRKENAGLSFASFCCSLVLPSARWWTTQLQVVQALSFFKEISLQLPHWEPVQEGFWLHFHWCWPAEWQLCSL